MRKPHLPAGLHDAGRSGRRDRHATLGSNTSETFTIGLIARDAQTTSAVGLHDAVGTGRRFWLLEPDAKPYRLTPLDAATATLQ